MECMLVSSLGKIEKNYDFDVRASLADSMKAEASLTFYKETPES